MDASLLRLKTSFLFDEYVRMHRLARTARTQTVRDLCAKRKADIEKEITARKAPHGRVEP